MIDVANVAESIGDAGQGKRQRYSDTWDEPSDNKRDPEEFVACAHFPAYLQMQGQSSPKDPDDNSPAAKDEKSAAEGACEVRVHVVWGDFIQALFGMTSQWEEKSKLEV